VKSFCGRKSGKHENSVVAPARAAEEHLQGRKKKFFNYSHLLEPQFDHLYIARMEVLERLGLRSPLAYELGSNEDGRSDLPPRESELRGSEKKILHPLWILRFACLRSSPCNFLTSKKPANRRVSIILDSQSVPTGTQSANHIVSDQPEVSAMSDEKDRFGETMRLLERAKEDIYFAERDRELIEKLKAQLQKLENQGSVLHCPKCSGRLQSYSFQGFVLDRCHDCGGIWLDKGELEGILRKATRGPLGAWIDKLMAKD
jgi:Transcription factor zinc-finger